MTTHGGYNGRIWLGVGVILVSIIAATIAFFYFSGAIGSQADQIAIVKLKASNDANALANLASLEGAAPQADQYDAAIHQLIPDQSGLISFNTWMGQVASQYQVNTSVAFTGDPTPSAGDTPGSATFSMTAQGPAGSIIPFLDYLTTHAPGFIVSFTSLDFTNTQSQESLSAQGVTYFR